MHSGENLVVTEGTAGEKTANSVSQSIEGEGRNAEKSLRNDQQFFDEDAQLHLLPQIGNSEGCRRHQYN